MTAAEALKQLQATQEAERAAMAALRAAIRAEREAGRSLAQIASDIGVTRQRVQQISEGR